MSGAGWISSHVLDTSAGCPGMRAKEVFSNAGAHTRAPPPPPLPRATRVCVCPAAGIAVALDFKARTGSMWKLVAKSVTDNDGRVGTLVKGLDPGVYKLTFDLSSYFKSKGTKSFYPEATVCFEVEDASEHFHIPLLLSPFGYSTYRGS